MCIVVILCLLYIEFHPNTWFLWRRERVIHTDFHVPDDLKAALKKEGLSDAIITQAFAELTSEEV